MATGSTTTNSSGTGGTTSENENNPGDPDELDAELVAGESEVADVVEDSGSTNIDLVEHKLYLGNLAAACDIPLLEKYRINFILTIDSCPLPSKITHLPFVETKFLQVCDIPREDILRYFEETYQFINKAVSNENCGNVLVHWYSKHIFLHSTDCTAMLLLQIVKQNITARLFLPCSYFGVSRSATIVLAYLMRKYEISLEDAQSRLKSRRSVIGPNYGFLSQLKLYEKMKFCIDKRNIFYKRFRLHVAADKIKSVKVLPTPYTDVIKCDAAVLTVKPEPLNFRCRKCRRILASASNLLIHTEKKSPVWFDLPADDSDVSEPICTEMYFIEPVAWMTSVAQSLQGKLHCPNQNCKSKLGAFSWVMGCVCPCGAKVQPAFYLVPSKVDRSTSVLNVQITI